VTPTFSLAILHAAHNPKRVLALRSMLLDLQPGAVGVPYRCFDERAEDRWDRWQHTLHPKIWGWALETPATHHVFMTDDLAIAPKFWPVLRAMVGAHPDAIIGLLSNHPAGPKLHARGAHWYRCNSWVVGPAYVIPRAHLAAFLPWYQAWIGTVDGTQYGDDSSLNMWISSHGPRESWHPLPTIIEHRSDLESTWQSGDCFSRERVSWRCERWAPLREEYEGLWTTVEKKRDLNEMCAEEYWRGSGPLLRVGGASEDEASYWKSEG
jgi:hypothetical protein